MIRKLTSVFILLVLLLSIVMPVYSDELVEMRFANEMQEQLYQVDELISLAASAARSGDMETAQRYEDILINYGVEIAVTNDSQAALSQLGMSDSVVVQDDSGIVVPEDTEAVHWYKYSVTNWYNYRTGAIMT